jgi:hypothetical protein
MRKVTSLNQNEMVITLLKRNPKKKVTTEWVKESINSLYLKGKRNKFTNAKVSMCLNRLASKNLVKRLETKTTDSKNRIVGQWQYAS